MRRRFRSGDGSAVRRPASRLRRLLRFAWRWGLRPALVVVVVVLALVWGAKAYHAVRSSTMTESERLTEDLARLRRVLLLEHPAPFRNAGRQDVEAAFARARAAIDRRASGAIDREQVLAHFYEVVTSLRDPHTEMAGRYDRFGILRVSFAIFGDEVRLVAAPDEADLGARVLAVDGMPTEEVLRRIGPLVPYANESGLLDGAPGVLRSPGLLHHAGVAERATGVTLELVRTDGSTAEMELPRITLQEYRERRPHRYSFEEDELPLYRRQEGEPYWLEVLSDRRALYIRFAGSFGFAERAMGEFARRALATRDEQGLELVIVDARGNPGGNPHAHVPLVAALASSPESRGPARLRVLVDRGTYSAAVVASADLERRAGALVVGEEPGDNAHLTTDARPFTLRHSGSEIWVPNGLMHTAGGAGNRPRLIPERPAAPTFEDWLAGRDPALEAALEPWLGAEDERAEGADAGLPTGRFAFDAQRTLTLERRGEAYLASVTGLGSDELERRPDGSWSGGIHRGLRADSTGALERRLPGGAWAKLPPRPADAPLELALERRIAEAAAAYRALTGDGADRQLVAELALTSEGIYRYREGAAEEGRALLDLARELSPADPLIPLQHSLLRKVAEGRWIPPADEFFRAVAACGRRYARAELLNDMRTCI